MLRVSCASPPIVLPTTSSTPPAFQLPQAPNALQQILSGFLSVPLTPSADGAPAPAQQSDSSHPANAQRLAELVTSFIQPAPSNIEASSKAQAALKQQTSRLNQTIARLLSVANNANVVAAQSMASSTTTTFDASRLPKPPDSSTIVANAISAALAGLQPVSYSTASSLGSQQQANNQQAFELFNENEIISEAGGRRSPCDRLFCAMSMHHLRTQLQQAETAMSAGQLMLNYNEINCVVAAQTEMEIASTRLGMGISIVVFGAIQSAGFDLLASATLVMAQAPEPVCPNITNRVERVIEPAVNPFIVDSSFSFSEVEPAQAALAVQSEQPEQPPAPRRSRSSPPRPATSADERSGSKRRNHTAPASAGHEALTPSQAAHIRAALGATGDFLLASGFLVLSAGVGGGLVQGSLIDIAHQMSVIARLEAEIAQTNHSLANVQRMCSTPLPAVNGNIGP